jgi:hypothetical protein
MATNKASSDNILNSNNFQVFLDSLMASDNNGLSSFLANQVKEDSADINSGAKNPKKLAKKKKSTKVKLNGTIKHNNNNTVYIPAIHNGETNENVSVVIGSTNPLESSAYKNMLKTDLMREVDETFAKLLMENKIPIINSGEVLSFIEVENNSQNECFNREEINSGKRSNSKKGQPKMHKGIISTKKYQEDISLESNGGTKNKLGKK